MWSPAAALAVIVVVIVAASLSRASSRANAAARATRRRAGGAAEMRARAWLARLRRSGSGGEVFLIPGARDLDDIQTLAALAIADALREPAASRGARVTTIAAHPMVLRVASEVERASPRTLPPESTRDSPTALYISEDPWGFAAGACGEMARARPARCMLAGGFSAEAILLAERAGELGATVFAGTADLAQAPALLLASDHALVGDELFAAAILAAERRPRSAWVRAQDRCKALALTAILAICGLLSIAEVSGSDTLRALAREIAGRAAPE